MVLLLLWKRLFRSVYSTALPPRRRSSPTPTKSPTKTNPKNEPALPIAIEHEFLNRQQPAPNLWVLFLHWTVNGYQQNRNSRKQYRNKNRHPTEVEDTTKRTPLVGDLRVVHQRHRPSITGKRKSVVRVRDPTSGGGRRGSIPPISHLLR